MADIQEVSHNFSTANVALVTTTEGVVITTPPIAVVRQTVTAFILASAQLTAGADTTTVTPRIRRGAAITSVLVGEAHAEAIPSAVATIQRSSHMASEELSNVASVVYSFTLSAEDASANATVLQAAILVLLI